MLQNKSVFLGAVYSYLITLLPSLIFLKIFRAFYVWEFNPPMYRSIFSLWSNNFELNFTGFIYSFVFFLPLVVFVFAERKKILIWVIGALIPSLLIVAGDRKELWWFVIFTLAGSLVGWLINLVIKKFKK